MGEHSARAAARTSEPPAPVDGGSQVPTAEPDRAATYREVFGVREFRYLFSAYLFSLIGDQLAKVALSIVVFDRTGSALLSAITFAVSYLPWLIGGPLLSVYADRLPRRAVMIGCDLIRMVLIGSLALPFLPLWSMVTLLFVASLLTPPFEAARAATTPEVLTGDRYAVGLALSNITAQLAQVIGFVAGGALVAVVSARGALVLDAVTFAVSAVLLTVGVRVRPAAEQGERASLLDDARTGIATVFGLPRVGLLIVMLWISSALGFAPEGLAAAYAAELGQGPATVGLLLAASPLGLILGGIVVGRMLRPSRRMVLLVPLAMLSVLALVPAAAVHWLPLILVLFLLSGFGFSYIIPLNVMVVKAIPAATRARAFGVVATGLQAVQGIGIVLAGLVADLLAPSIVVTLCGILGTVVVGAIGVRDRLNRRGVQIPQPRTSGP